MVWGKFDDLYPTHPKMLAAGVDALGFDVAGVLYANRYLTDGFIADATIWAVYPPERDPLRLAAKLVEVGRWERDDERGGWLIHDFTDYNRTAAEVNEIRQKRKTAGQEGGKASGRSRARSSEDASTTDEANAKQVASSVASPRTNTRTQVKPLGTEGSTRGSPKSYSPSAARNAPRSKRKKPEEHPDARRLCELLADLIADNANGDRPFRPGQVPAKWLDEARKLLTIDGEDGDGYSVVQVEYLIRWSQADSFEAGVVQSMPKLRERRRVLVGKIKPKANGRRPLPNTADLDARVEATLRDLEGAPPGPGASDEERAAYYARFSQEVPA